MGVLQASGRRDGPAVRTFGPMMAFDKMDPDLRELGADAPYLPADGTL